MPPPSDQHLARVTPIDPVHSHRVMNKWSLRFNAFKLIVLQTSWVWFALVAAFWFNSPIESAANISFFAWQIAAVLLVFQISIIFIYPQWPVNLSLCDNLRDSIAGRDNNKVADEFDRVVELVPRDRWEQFSFETATDLLVIRVNDDGVWMEGDVDRYELPAESILSAQFQAVQPPGWYTSANMIIITAKTKTGSIELPIAYRDHQFGELRNSRRRQNAMRLVDKINRIAQGGHYQFVVEPDHQVIARSACDDNPYAAPALLSD